MSLIVLLGGLGAPILEIKARVRDIPPPLFGLWPGEIAVQVLERFHNELSLVNAGEGCFCKTSNCDTEEKNRRRCKWFLAFGEKHLEAPALG